MGGRSNAFITATPQGVHLGDFLEGNISRRVEVVDVRVQNHVARGSFKLALPWQTLGVCLLEGLNKQAATLKGEDSFFFFYAFSPVSSAVFYPRGDWRVHGSFLYLLFTCFLSSASRGALLLEPLLQEFLVVLHISFFEEFDYLFRELDRLFALHELLFLLLLLLLRNS